MGIREDWNDKILVFDGGMGSLLQGAGLKPGELPETWNIKHPEVLVKIHEDYLNAGANIILSNTFGANRLKYFVIGAMRTIKPRNHHPASQTETP